MTWVWKRALSSLALSDILPQNWKHSDLAINSWLSKKRLVLHSKVAESFKMLFRDEKNVNHVIFEKKNISETVDKFSDHCDHSLPTSSELLWWEWMGAKQATWW